MDLETVTQRFEVDASGFAAGMEQVRRSMGTYSEAVQQANAKAAGSLGQTAAAFSALAGATSKDVFTGLKDASGSLGQTASAFNTLADATSKAKEAIGEVSGDISKSTDAWSESVKQAVVASGTSLEALSALLAAEGVSFEEFKQKVSGTLGGPEMADGVKAGVQAALNEVEGLGEGFAATSSKIGRETGSWGRYLEGASGATHIHARTMSREIAQMALQFASGTGSIRSFAQEMTFLLGSISPFAGLVAAGAVAIGSLVVGMLGLGGKSKEASDAIDDLSKSLQTLGGQDDKVAKLAESMSKLSGSAAEQGAIEIKISLQDIQPQIDAAKKKILDLSQIVTVAIPATRAPPVTEAAPGVADADAPEAARARGQAARDLTALRDAVRENKIELAAAGQALSVFAQQAHTAFPGMAAQADATASSVAKINDQLIAHPEQAQQLQAQASALIDQLVTTIASRQGDVQGALKDALSLGDTKGLDPAIVKRVEDAKKAFGELANSFTATELLAAFDALKESAGKTFPDLVAKIDAAIRELQKFKAEQAGLKTAAVVGAHPELFGAEAAAGQAGEIARRQSQARPATAVAAEQAQPSGVAAAAFVLEKQAERTRELEKAGRTQTAIVEILKEEAALNVQLLKPAQDRVSAAVAELDAQKALSAELAKQTAARAAARAALPVQVQDLQKQNAAARMPTQELRDAATEAAALGASLADLQTPDSLMRFLQTLAPSLREGTAQLAHFKQEARGIQLGAQTQQQQNQNVAALVPPGPTRAAAQAMSSIAIDLDPRGTVTTTAAALEAVHAKLDSLDEPTKKFIAGMVSAQEQAARISFRTGVEDEIIKNQVLLDYGGRETAEERLQVALTEAKLRLGGSFGPLDEERIRALQAQNETIRQQNALVQEQQRGAVAKAQVQAASSLPDILSQQALGIPAEQTRVQDQIQQHQAQGDTITPELTKQIQDTEEWNTRLAITNRLLPNIADSMTQIEQTAMFEGPEAAGQAFLKTLSQMALQLGNMIILQTIFNALMAASGGGTFTGASTQSAGATTAGAGMFGLLGHAQQGGPLNAGQRTRVAEDRQAELWVGDSAARRMTRGGMDASTMAAATGLPESQVRRMSATPGGKALLGMVAESGGSARPPASSGGMKLLGAKGQPEVFVAPESGTVIPNPDLRALQATPAGRQVLRRVGFAAGGQVERGQRVLVGEEGEERWVPDRLFAEAFRTQAPPDHTYASRLFAPNARPEGLGLAVVASASDAHAVAAIARRGDPKDVPGFPYRGVAVVQHLVGRIGVGERARRDDARDRLDLIHEDGHLFVPMPATVPTRWALAEAEHIDHDGLPAPDARGRHSRFAALARANLRIPGHTTAAATQKNFKEDWGSHPPLPLDGSSRLVDPLELVGGDRVRPPAMVEREVAVRARQDAFFGHDLERPFDADGAREGFFAPARHLLRQPAIMPGKPQDVARYPVGVWDQQIASHSPLLPDRLLQSVFKILPIARSDVVVGHGVQVGLQALKGGVVAPQRVEEGVLHTSGVDPAVGHMDPQRRSIELGSHEALPRALDLLVGHRLPHVSKSLVPSDDAAPGGLVLGHFSVTPDRRSVQFVPRDRQLDVEPALPRFFDEILGFDREARVDAQFGKRLTIAMRDDERLLRTVDVDAGHREAGLQGDAFKFGPHEAAPHDVDFVVGHPAPSVSETLRPSDVVDAVGPVARAARASVSIPPIASQAIAAQAWRQHFSAALPFASHARIQDLGLDREVDVDLGDDGFEHRAEGDYLRFQLSDTSPRAFQFSDRGVPVWTSRAAAQLFGDPDIGERVGHRLAPFGELGIGASVVHRSALPQLRAQIDDFGAPRQDAFLRGLEHANRLVVPETQPSERVLQGLDPRLGGLERYDRPTSHQPVGLPQRVEPFVEFIGRGIVVGRQAADGLEIDSRQPSAPFIVADRHASDAVDDVAQHLAPTFAERLDRVERVHHEHLSRVVRDIIRLAVDQRQILEQSDAVRDLALPPVDVTDEGPTRVVGQHLRPLVGDHVADRHTIAIQPFVTRRGWVSSAFPIRPQDTFGRDDSVSFPPMRDQAASEQIPSPMDWFAPELGDRLRAVQAIGGEIAVKDFKPRPGPAQRFDHLGRPAALSEVVDRQIHAVQPGEPRVQFGVAGTVVAHGLGLLPGGHVDVEHAYRLAGLRLPDQLSVQRFGHLGKIKPPIETDFPRIVGINVHPSDTVISSVKRFDQHLGRDGHLGRLLGLHVDDARRLQTEAEPHGLKAHQLVQVGVQPLGRLGQFEPTIDEDGLVRTVEPVLKPNTGTGTRMESIEQHFGRDAHRSVLVHPWTEPPREFGLQLRDAFPRVLERVDRALPAIQPFIQTSARSQIDALDSVELAEPFGQFGVGDKVIHRSAHFDASSQPLRRSASDGGTHPIHPLAGLGLVGFDGFEPRPGLSQRLDHLVRPVALNEVVHREIHAVQAGEPRVQFGVAGAVVGHGLGPLFSAHVADRHDPVAMPASFVGPLESRGDKPASTFESMQPFRFGVQQRGRLDQVEVPVHSDAAHISRYRPATAVIDFAAVADGHQEHLGRDHWSVHFMPRAAERGLMERPVELGVQKLGRFDQVYPAVADVDKGHVPVVGDVPLGRKRGEALVHDPHDHLGREHESVLGFTEKPLRPVDGALLNVGRRITETEFARATSGPYESVTSRLSFAPFAFFEMDAPTAPAMIPTAPTIPPASAHGMPKHSHNLLPVVSFEAVPPHAFDPISFPKHVSGKLPVDVGLGHRMVEYVSREGFRGAQLGEAGDRQQVAPAHLGDQDLVGQSFEQLRLVQPDLHPIHGLKESLFDRQSVQRSVKPIPHFFDGHDWSDAQVVGHVGELTRFANLSRVGDLVDGFVRHHATLPPSVGVVPATIPLTNQAPSSLAAVAGMVLEGLAAPAVLSAALAAAPAAAAPAGEGAAAPAGDGGGAAVAAAAAALSVGGPLRAGQKADVGEKGSELVLRGRLADAARAGRLEKELPSLARLPKNDWPTVVGQRGQERIVADRQVEVLSNDAFRRLASTSSGRQMLALIGAPAPAAASAARAAMPGTEQVRHLASGTVDTTQMLSQHSPSAGGHQQIVVNNAAPEFRVIDQRQTGSPPIEMSSQRGPDGRMVITAMVRAATAEMLRTGEHQSVMRNVYGLTPRPRA